VEHYPELAEPLANEVELVKTVRTVKGVEVNGVSAM